MEDSGLAGLPEPDPEPHHRVGTAGRVAALRLLCQRGKVPGDPTAQKSPAGVDIGALTDTFSRQVGDFVLFGTYIIQLYTPLNWFGTYYR